MKFQIGGKTIYSNEILNYILDENYADAFVVAYSSSMDGVGNSKSDIDIYVLTQNKTFNDNHAVIRNYVINGIDLDAEYWNLEVLVAQLNSVKTNFSAENLKTIHRIKKGIIIKSNEMISDILGNSLNRINESKMYIKSKILSLNSAHADALKFFYCNDYESAIFCERKALESAVMVINALNGFDNINDKWASFIFRSKIKDIPIEYKKKYLYFQVYTPLITEQSIKAFLSDFIQFIQSLIFYISLERKNEI